MDFKTYYNSRFRNDVDRLFSTIPDDSKYHEDLENRQIMSIQYERLTSAFNHLDFLEKDVKEYFAVALFFIILIDMVCFKYFNAYYNKFRYLTRYPKFIGNCRIGCHYHHHPENIFTAMNKGYSRTDQILIFNSKFFEAIPIIKEETMIYFKKYITDLDVNSFWEKCEEEFPFKS